MVEPNTVRDAGKVIFCKAVHPANMSVSIEVTKQGVSKSMASIWVLFLKALVEIDATSNTDKTLRGITTEVDTL